jgi:putative FmdB family regulatory protein
MPLYEYQCKSCGFKFEKMRAMIEADEPIMCLKCLSRETRRMLSRFNAHSEGKAITNNTCSCGNCSGGSCSSCQN